MRLDHANGILVPKGIRELVPTLRENSVCWYDRNWMRNHINILSLEEFLQLLALYSLNLNQSNFHWLNHLFAFSLIHQWKNIFTVKSVNFHWFISEKYFSLSNQSIFTEIISGIWLIYSNLFLAIWICQISLIISRFWLIQI